tara:strand:+ start:98862 stop:99167 length:306 start_codon:yes stop_codon:yes gene_type:complete
MKDMTHKETPKFIIGNGTSDLNRNTMLEVHYNNTVLIGTNLISNESHEIVMGNGDDCIRLKGNGDIYWKGDKIENLSNDLIIEFNNLIRENIKAVIALKHK